MLKFDLQKSQYSPSFENIIKRDLLDEILHLFYCLLFPVRVFKKKEIQVGGGSLSLEIPAGESSSDLGNHPLVGCTFFSGKSFI